MNTNPFTSITERLDEITSQMRKLQELIVSERRDKQEFTTDVEQNFTIAELAHYLGCTKQTIHNLKKDGHLPYYRLARNIYFKKSEVDQVAQVRKISKLKGPKFLQHQFSNN